MGTNNFMKKTSKTKQISIPFIFISFWYTMIIYAFLLSEYLYFICDKPTFRFYYPFFESDSPICIGLFILPLIVLALIMMTIKGVIKQKFAVVMGISYTLLFCLTGIVYSLPFMKASYDVYCLTTLSHLLIHPTHTFSIFLFSTLGLTGCLLLILVYSVTKKMDMRFWSIACYWYWVTFINFINIGAFYLISIIFFTILIIDYNTSFLKKHYLIVSLWTFLLVLIIFKINRAFKWLVYGFPAVFGGCISSLIFLFAWIGLKNKTKNSIEISMISGLFCCLFVSLNNGVPLKLILIAFLVLLTILFILRLFIKTEKKLSPQKIRYMKRFFVLGCLFLFPVLTNLIYFLPEKIFHSPEVQIIAHIDHPHSVLLKQKGEQLLLTGDSELQWINVQTNQHEIFKTNDYVQEAQHIAIGHDEKIIYLVPKIYDAILGIDLTKSFKHIYTVRPVNLSFPEELFFSGTSWPLITKENMIIVSENGFMVRCPFDKKQRCQSLHFAYSLSGKTLIETINATIKNYLKTDAVILSQDLTKLYIVINDPPYGVLVFDSSTLQLINHLLKDHEIEYLMLNKNLLYCSAPKDGKIAIINILTDHMIQWMDAFIGVNAVVYAKNNDCFYASSFKNPYVYESKDLNAPFQKKWRVSRIIKNMTFNPSNNSILVVGRDSNRVYQIHLKNKD